MSSDGEETVQVNPKVTDFILVVKNLHGHSSQDLSKLIGDAANNTLELSTETGQSIQIDLEDLSRIPIHLTAKLVQSDLDEELFRYVLSGLRLLHNMYDIAPRHPKLEQIWLDDIPLLRQLIELIFYVLMVLNSYTQGRQLSAPSTLLHSTLVASSLLLFEKFVSSHPSEVANILVSHPKVDRFMDAVFAAVRIDIYLLQVNMLGKHSDPMTPTAEEAVKHLCVQCEVSLKYLHLLCQQKIFRDRLVQHKELCGKAGILLLARAVLELDLTAFHKAHFVVGAVSRMQSKVLSILLLLCEAESISYLDEVAGTPGSLILAKSVALEVLELLKTLFNGYHKEPSSCSDKNIPKGLLQLNAMRLADIFSDDSNFRCYITVHITEVLITLFSLPPGDFLSRWCASDLPVWEEDATLEYDPFLEAGRVLNLLSSSNPSVMLSSEYTFTPCNMPRASYAHQRTSLLIKVIANLHCFVPHICKDEKNLFLNSLFQCLQKELLNLSNESFSNSAAEKLASISRNLRSLLSHAESLVPSFVNEEDEDLLRKFVKQLETLMSTLEFKMNQAQESHSIGGCSSPPSRKASPDHNSRTDDLKEGVCKSSALQEVDQTYVGGKDSDQADDELREYRNSDKNKPGKAAARGLGEIDRDAQNVETSGSGSSSTRGKNSIDQINDVHEEEKNATTKSADKQRMKRKRTIMNDTQTTLIEKALLDKPDMQRHAAALQSWADQLSEHGSEVTASQLKNWLNNRKARLARVAKDVRGLSEGDNPLNDKQGEPGIRALNDSSESLVEDVYVPLVPQAGCQDETGGSIGSKNQGNVAAGLVNIVPVEGQYVMLANEQGEEIGKAKVYQVHGIWYGKNLEELGACVVDIIELKIHRWARLPYPFEDTGTSFYLAEKKYGVMRVLWDSKKLFMFQR